MLTSHPHLDSMHRYECGIQGLMWCNHIPIIDYLAHILAIGCTFESSCLSHWLCNWCHDERKVLDGALIKLSYAIEDLNVTWRFR
jgi:hypothetical protein